MKYQLQKLLGFYLQVIPSIHSTMNFQDKILGDKHKIASPWLLEKVNDIRVVNKIHSHCKVCINLNYLLSRGTSGTS